MKNPNGLNQVELLGSSEWKRLHWYHWVIVSLSLMLTLFAWNMSKSQSDKRRTLKFETEVRMVTDLLRERLELYESGLQAGVAAINMNNNEVNSLEWKKFSDSLDIDKKYPGTLGIGVIFKVKRENLDQFLRKQKELRHDFKIHPSHDRNELWPITYIEPVENNLKAVGLDMAFETNRYEAIKSAERLGKAQVTGPIILVQDSEKTPGFLFFNPVYDESKKFIGVVYAPLIMKSLMKGTLENTNRHVNIGISDLNVEIFSEHNEQHHDYDPAPLYSKKFTLDVHGREWDFDIRSSKSFRVISKDNQSDFILIFGIIIDVILLLLFVVLSNSKNKSIRYAELVTKELRIKNDELNEFAYRTSHDLVAPLKSATGLVAFMKEDLENKDYSEISLNLIRLDKLCSKLIILVGDILSLSKADNERSPNEKIDFETIKDDILERLSLLISETKVNVSFHYDLDGAVYHQKTRIVQLLENLISNGVKYRNSDREERFVKVFIAKKDKDIRIKVMDNGIGVPEEYQDQVFEIFKRFDPGVSYGSGLGLYLVRKHIDKLGGEISLESDSNGTTFDIRLTMELDT